MNSKNEGLVGQITLTKEIVDTDIANLRGLGTWFTSFFAFFARLLGRALFFSSRLFSRATEEELHLLRSCSEIWHDWGVC
jgi:hypothetical protein